MPEPPLAAGTERRFRYAAFISYKRDVDLKIASALQVGLRRMTKPWYRLPSIRVCRDKTDLVLNPGLWSAIQQRLDDSEHLILLASPEGAASPWVEREVHDWVVRRSPDKLLLVLTAGDIAWDPAAKDFDAVRTTALPASVRSIFSEEPAYLDLRWARTSSSLSLKHAPFRDAVAELLARLTGREKADVLGEDLRQQRRLLRLAWSAVATLLVLASVAVAAAWFAVRQRQVAEEQRTIAVARQLVAQSRLLANERPALLDRSALLAVEGARRFASIEADQALRQSAGLLARLETTLTQDDPVSALAVSPGGRYLATAAAPRNTGRLWDHVGRREVARFNHGAGLTAVLFSADGHWVATSSHDGSAAVWDGTTGAEIVRVRHEAIDTNTMPMTAEGVGRSRVKRLPPSLNAIAFSADRRFLATASDDHTTRVWELPAGREVWRAHHDEAVQAVAFSPDGRFVASASDDSTTRVWDADAGHEVKRFTHDDRVEWVTFSTDGRRVASSGFDGTARVWDLDGQRPPIVLRHDRSVTKVVFSPAGNLIATAGRDGTARIWEASGRELSRSQHQGAVEAIVFSADSRRLATASDDGTGKLLDVPSGQEIARVVHQRPVRDVAFSPDGRSIVTASSDATVKFWSATGGGEVLRVTHEGRSRNEAVEAIAFSADENHLVTVGGGFDDTARLWELSSGREILRTPRLSRIGVAAMTSPDGSELISTERDVVKIWDAKRRTPLAELKTEGLDFAALMKQGAVSSSGAVFSPDGRRLAKVVSGVAYVWDVDRARAALRYKSEPGADRLAFSANGRYLAIGRLARDSPDQTIEIRDVELGRETGRMTHQGPVHTLAVSSNGTLIAAPDSRSVENIFGLRDPGRGLSLRLWDVGTGTILHAVTYEAPVVSIAFDRDDRHLAVGTAEGIGSILEVATALEVARVRHQRGVSDVVFSGSGRYVGTASEDGTARVWLWRTSDLIADACGRLSRNLTWPEWQQYQPAGTPYNKTCNNLPVHPSLVEAARTLAREHHADAAITLFQRASELEASLGLKPAEEARRWAAMAEGERVAADAERLARNGDVKGALDAMARARILNPDLDKSSQPWNQVCWFGALRGHAYLVLDTCNKAVALGGGDERIRDSRGIARALTGDTKGAIEDFEAFIAEGVDERKIALRRQWVEALRGGQNPLTAAVLQQLLVGGR